jgi:hypothetical protein
VKRHKVPKSPIRSSAADLVASRFRQIHLDFHTSELIPDVAVDFDPDQFAERLAEAKVNWVTLFAKCHHGLSYYPTEVGTVHPALRTDLLGRQIEACRRRGIVTPAYISVRVDEHHARIDPGWVARLKDGKAWKWGGTLEAGWYQLCMNNAEYVEELAAQAEEVLRFYDVEGVFFDMCYTAVPGCYCPRCEKGMRDAGLDFTSDVDHQTHEYLVTRAYTKRLARAVRGMRKNATLFFNGRMRPWVKDELDVLSHCEIEALPTGGWGYGFYPVHARYARMLGKPVQGMTARFHKSWADFGGLKTRDQLLYEAGTVLAAGGVISVGDQCHPRGVLDKGAYQVIGEVYRHVEACEPWCRGARAETEVAVMMLPQSAGADIMAPGVAKLRTAVDGAGRMLLELKQQFDLVYPDSDLARYKVVIVPDEGQLTPEAASTLKRFLAAGGSLLTSYRACFDGKRFELPEIPVSLIGEHPYKPSYLELGRRLGKGLPATRYVLYEGAAQVRPARGAEALGRLCTTYFNRAHDHFCSHNQTPDDKLTSHPIFVQKGKHGYLSPAIFTGYRQHAVPLYKEVVRRALETLLPEPLVLAKAPSSMEISLHRQTKPKRLVVHLVNFQPQRRHVDVEWIDELYPVRDIALRVRTAREPSAVYLAPSRRELPFVMNGKYAELTVPEVHAHELVVLEGV